MTNPTYKLLEEARSLYGADGWIERNGDVVYSDDLVHELAEALERVLEGLYKVYVNLGEDTDGARNAKELFGPWVGFDPAKHIPDLVMEHRKDWENAYEEGYADGQRYSGGVNK